MRAFTFIDHRIALLTGGLPADSFRNKGFDRDLDCDLQMILLMIPRVFGPIIGVKMKVRSREGDCEKREETQLSIKEIHAHENH